MNEQLMEMLKSLISEEMIEYVIREKVDEICNYRFEKCIDEKIDSVIGDRAKEFVKEHIDKVMESGVRIDDGWGRIEHHGSFEDYVRKYIRDCLSKSWNVSKMVREEVEKRLKKYIEELVREKTEIGSDEVLARAYNDMIAKGE